jgi:hypothetical protein
MTVRVGRRTAKAAGRDAVSQPLAAMGGERRPYCTPCQPHAGRGCWRFTLLSARRASRPTAPAPCTKPRASTARSSSRDCWRRALPGWPRGGWLRRPVVGGSEKTAHPESGCSRVDAEDRQSQCDERLLRRAAHPRASGLRQRTTTCAGLSPSDDPAIGCGMVFACGRKGA